MTEMAEAPLAWNAAAVSDVLSALDAAVASAKSAERLQDADSVADADTRLRAAIDAAREAGVAWGAIGDRLGIARGNAYQKYRRRG